MPRRDGFPTNRELQVDFTSAARDVFVAAAERQLESKISLNLLYEGKPLDHLYLRISRANDVTEGSPTAVYGEELNITPLQKSTTEDLLYDRGDGGFMPGNELFKDADEAVIEHYKSLAQEIGGLTITDDLRFGRLGPNAIEANWWAFLTRKGRASRRHAGTFLERPAKQSLVAAKFFVDEAMNYVQSDEFDEPMPVRRVNYLAGFDSANPEFAMRHRFGLYITPDLPLNGHESKSFITRYWAEMSRKQTATEERLSQLTELGAPQLLLDNLAERVGLLEKAKSRAEKLLSAQ